MAEKPGIEINGERYEIPTLDTIDLDEERILYVYADAVLQDFADPHPEWNEDDKRAYEVAQLRKIRNPDFKRALAHIAYRRRNPELSDDDIQQALGKISALAMDRALIRGSDDDPPAQSSQSEPEKPSDTATPLRLTASGSDTETSSEHPEEIPAATGTTESATSSRGAVPIELVS